VVTSSLTRCYTPYRSWFNVGKRFVTSEDCAAFLKLRPAPISSLKLGPMPRAPGVKIAVDIYGPIRDPNNVTDNSGYIYYLTVTDVLTRQLLVYPMISSTSEMVKSAPLFHLLTWSFRSVSLSDSGSSFKALSQWAHSCGVQWNKLMVHRDLNEYLRAAIASEEFRKVLTQNTRAKSGSHSPADLLPTFKLQLPG
jgi:hypothetical protein